MSDIPDLQYYKVCISRNGGPIAIMLKENAFFIGKKLDDKKLKNVIYFFNSYGRLFNTVYLSNMIEGLDPN